MKLADLNLCVESTCEEVFETGLNKCPLCGCTEFLNLSVVLDRKEVIYVPCDKR